MIAALGMRAVAHSRPLLVVATTVALLVVLAASACGDDVQESGAAVPTDNATAATDDGQTFSPESRAQVTFVELGSDSCIPCKEMRPIMAEIEKKYSGSVEVVFYDVYEQGDKAEEFAVRVIPTQVFLDESGNEFYRHEGFLTLMAIESLLAERGIEPTDGQ
jgi:thioredoxin 1